MVFTLQISILVQHIDTERLVNSDNETIAADLFVVGDAIVVTKEEKEVRNNEYRYCLSCDRL